jgi:two-component system, cell cycle response regulator DivK
VTDKAPLTILVVEDEPLNLDMLTRRPRRSGFVVLQALDGRNGVARATTDLPDLILMDIGLPNLSGLGAIRQLRADAQTKDLKIVALTAHALSGDWEKAIDAGADDYATKPMDYPGLVAKIGTVSRRRVWNPRDALVGKIVRLGQNLL